MRQAPIDIYFADFVCRDQRLIVEIDGPTHASDDEIAADALRDKALRRLGYRIFRVTNEDAFDNVEGVLDELLARLEGRPD